MRGLLDSRSSIAIPRRAQWRAGVFPAITDYSDARKYTKGRRAGKLAHVEASNETVGRVMELGVQPMVRDLVDPVRPTWHDREKLAKAFQEVLAACHSRQR